MQSQVGYLNGFHAIRYSNGKVFFNVGGNWYQAIGNEDSFIPR